MTARRDVVLGYLVYDLAEQPFSFVGIGLLLERRERSFCLRLEAVPVRAEEVCEGLVRGWNCQGTG